MSFAEIEAVLEAKLPRSAYEHREWWANESTGSHVQARAWMEAGFETANVNIDAGEVTFRRVRESGSRSAAQGMEDRVVSYASAPAPATRRNPLFGAMKGTFWLDPSVDPTKPSLDPGETAAWDTSLDRKADQLDAGLKRKP